MNYNHPQAQKTAAFVRVVCGFLFCFFSFFFLWKIQGYVMGMAQHVLSGGLTVYSPLVGAGIITFLLLLLQILLNRIFRLEREWHTVSFFPSFFTLAMLTSVNATAYTEFSLGYWIWFYPLCWMLFFCAVSFFKHLPSTYDERAGGVAAKMLIPNLIIFLLFIVFCISFSNTDETLHHQMQMEYMVSQKDYDEALEVGKGSKTINRETTALRAYSLYKKDELGERLFNYPQQYGSEGLLLDLKDSVRMIFQPMELYKQLGAYPRFHKEPALEFLELLDLSEKARQPMAEQYLLCAYLLDRKIDKFVLKLSEVYNLNDSVVELPRYYGEALVMYLRKNPGRYAYRNEILETNYADYRNMVRSVRSSTLALNKTRRDFGTTYWWYYDALSKE